MNLFQLTSAGCRSLLTNSCRIGDGDSGIPRCTSISSISFSSSLMRALLHLSLLWAFNSPRFRVIENFISRLNRALDDVPAGRHYHLDIFRLTPWNWFITTKKSPRFIRKRLMTHFECERNLDFMPLDISMYHHGNLRPLQKIGIIPHFLNSTAQGTL